MEELKPLDYDKKKIITANKTPTETVDINREKKSKNRILRSISDEERCTKRIY